MPWMPYITLFIAVLGAILGIVNTWLAISRSRVLLSLSFTSSAPQNARQMPPEYLNIEVVNLSAFPVTVREIGLLADNGRLRVPCGNESLLWDVLVPRKLDSRESANFVYPIRHLNHSLSYDGIYAATACRKWVHLRANDIGRLVQGSEPSYDPGQELSPSGASGRLRARKRGLPSR